jgi:molybdopterin-guanine dinucleotide biosynthesis protein A
VSLLAVVVLAGGEGRRMGGAKPRRRFGDTTLLGHALALARRWSPLVAVAVRRASQLPPGLAAPWILDPPEIGGPIAGLAAAFAFARAHGAQRLLTLPCDAPNLPTDLPQRLELQLRAALCALPATRGQRHPACALWRISADLQLPAYLATGRRSLNGFADHCGAVEADWPLGARDADPFANANTPEQLAALQPPGAA